MSKLGLTPIFTSEQLDQWNALFIEQAEDMMIELLKAAGEAFVKYARELHTYEDQTGNLRSSIGYIIISEGVTIIENFQEGDKGTDKVTGYNKAGQLAETIGTTYQTGLILIGVAGMQYAAAVEAKGYDVITGACQQAEMWMRKAITETLNKKNNG